MNDFQRSMKLSLSLGIAGAVVIPLMFECYANISRGCALVIMGVLSVFTGLKFSALRPKEAAVGMAASLAYTGIFGLIVYVFIHPRIVAFLAKNSKYFYLDLETIGTLAVSTALIMLGMFAVCFAKMGVVKAVKHIIGNREKAADYIDNAFDEEENK